MLPTHPRYWGIIYALLILLLVVIVGAHQWAPVTITITIAPLVFYGLLGVPLWALALWTHVNIGDRFDEIYDRFWRWCDPDNSASRYDYIEPPSASNAYTGQTERIETDLKIDA